MKVRYIYSACIVIETPDIRVCCDPWFTDGIYDGAWFQFPKVLNPVQSLGPIDFIFVSHIHPDHYDPMWIKTILKANPLAKILIGTKNQRHLEKKMNRDGFNPEKFDEIIVGQTKIACFPNFEEQVESIDSALVIKFNDQCVVNLNDCPFDKEQVSAIVDFCSGSRIAAFLPYAGAGPYPQRYLFESEQERVNEASNKKDKFLDLFSHYVDELKPQFAVPFAGQYFLGGSLQRFNETRGVPDALEAARRFPGVGVVLQEEVGTIDLGEGEVHGVRTELVNIKAAMEYLSGSELQVLPYENEVMPLAEGLFRDLEVALSRALERSRLRIDVWVTIPLGDGTFGCLKPLDGVPVQRLKSLESCLPREEIYVDIRHLSGLLHRRYHWNNAEIGSHFDFRRVGMSYSKELYDFLSFLHL